MKIIYFLFSFILIANAGFSQMTYKFIGNGYWTDPANWLNNIIPPDSLTNGDTIYIKAMLGGSCVLNRSQTVSPGTSLIVADGVDFIIPAGLCIRNNPRLKTILYPVDSIAPLCSPACPLSVFQVVETFVYDNLDRLSKRLLTRVALSQEPVITDTTSVYSYQYFGDNSLITAYTDERTSAVPVNHTISYDNLNRIVSDSIINPQGDNNKVTCFTYLTDTIIQSERQSFPVGTEVKIDTLLFSGNNVFKEKIKFYSTFKEIAFTLTSYRNPLSYVNNFSLLGSDLKNGSNSTLYMIYTPQFITYNQAAETLVTNSSNGSGTSQYRSVYTITNDVFGTVKSFTNISMGNKITAFEYY